MLQSRPVGWWTVTVRVPVKVKLPRSSRSCSAEWISVSCRRTCHSVSLKYSLCGSWALPCEVTSFKEQAGRLLLCGFNWGQGQSAAGLTSSPRAVRDSACMSPTSGLSEGCIQHRAPVILIPSQISLQKQTDVDGCHDVWMLQPWKIYTFFSLNLPKKKNKTDDVMELYSVAVETACWPVSTMIEP